MEKHHTKTLVSGDRNFDDLAHRFERNVYQSLKGKIRLGVIERDLQEFSSELFTASQKPLRILDVGAGRAPISIKLAQLGHQVTLVDVSVEMLKHAYADAEQSGVLDRIEFFHGSGQAYSEQAASVGNKSFDLILCHAVVEWLQSPQPLMIYLTDLLASGGLLSLSFYNVHGGVFKNLLRTNFKRINRQDFSGSKRSLTPRYPRTISEVFSWFELLPVTRLCHSGIRVFHDYIFNEQDRDREPEELLKWELFYSRESPFRELGRYQHLLYKRLPVQI